MYNVEQVAEHLQVTEETVRRRIRAGIIKATTKTGGDGRCKQFQIAIDDLPPKVLVPKHARTKPLKPQPLNVMLRLDKELDTLIRETGVLCIIAKRNETRSDMIREALRIGIASIKEDLKKLEA